MRPAVRRGNSWIMHQGSPCQTTPLQSRCSQSEALKQHGGMKERIKYGINYEVIVSLFSDCIFLLHTMSSFVTPNPSHWAHFQSFICLQLLPCYTWCPPKQTKLPWVASEAGNDTRPVAFCARFRKNGANKASKEMEFSHWCGDKLFNKEKESEMVFWCFVWYLLSMHNAQSPRHESRLKQTACGCVICKYRKVRNVDLRQRNQHLWC